MISQVPLAFWCIDGAWIAWLTIWMVMAQRVKPTIARESMIRRVAHLLPLVLAAALIFICPFGKGWWTCRTVFGRAPWMAPAGAGLVLCGLGFAVWARVVLAENWSGIVTLKHQHELVRSGPYAIARHPIYTGLLIALLGTAIAIDQWRGWLAWAVVAASFVAKMRTEERFMSAAFGDVYETYRTKVAALVPWIW